MKKIVSLILLVAMTVGVTSILSGCKIKVKGGTVAAKLLLANERLDENFVGKEIDLGLEYTFSGDGEKAYSSATRQIFGESRVIAASASTPANIYTPDSFYAFEDPLDQFEAFVINIEHQAGRVAKSIANMKNNVGIIDKWVGNTGITGETQLLRVFEKSDMLIAKNTEVDCIDVTYRYTDDDANNVYEMYSFLEYNDGTTGEIRTVFIPDQLYEYNFINSGGSEDYVIVEKSRGYWTFTRYNYHIDGGEEGLNLTSVSVKDGLGYTTSLSFYNTVDNVSSRSACSVVDMESRTKLFNIYKDESGIRNYELTVSPLISGLELIGGDGDRLTYLKTAKGEFRFDHENTDTDASMFFIGGRREKHYMENGYMGTLIFSETEAADSAQKSVDNFANTLVHYGLDIAVNGGNTSDVMLYALGISETFKDSFEWNGYKMTSLENVRAARDVLKKDFNNAKAEYQEVKDFDTAVGRYKLDWGLGFAKVGAVTMGENSYADGNITLSGINAAIDDTVLFENGKAYTLKVALSLCDGEGNPISVNTVPLSGGASQAASFSGGAITLTASGSFAVPKNLISGDYAVVVYAATADEGIRVSEMVKVGAFSTYNETLESEAMNITVRNVSDTLHFEYKIKNSYTKNMTAEKASYTLSELERVAMIEILKHGAPFSGARLEFANGDEISSDTPLGKGSYRIMCYLATSDGLAQSYLYLNLE